MSGAGRRGARGRRSGLTRAQGDPGDQRRFVLGRHVADADADTLALEALLLAAIEHLADEREVALKLRQGARTLLLAAAHSVVAPRPWFPRLSRNEAVGLLSQVQEAQTHRGSFVMRWLVPVEPVVEVVPEASVAALSAVRPERSGLWPVKRRISR